MQVREDDPLKELNITLVNLGTAVQLRQGNSQTARVPGKKRLGNNLSKTHEAEYLSFIYLVVVMERSQFPMKSPCDPAVISWHKGLTVPLDIRTTAFDRKP